MFSKMRVLKSLLFSWWNSSKISRTEKLRLRLTTSAVLCNSFLSPPRCRAKARRVSGQRISAQPTLSNAEGWAKRLRAMSWRSIARWVECLAAEQCSQNLLMSRSVGDASRAAKPAGSSNSESRNAIEQVAFLNLHEYVRLLHLHAAMFLTRATSRCTAL